MHYSCTVSVMMPRCCDVREETFRALILLNNVNSSVATSKVTDVAAVVVEE